MAKRQVVFLVWEDMAYLGTGEGHGPCSSLPLPIGLGHPPHGAGFGRVGHCSARSPVSQQETFWATNSGCLLGILAESPSGWA